VSAHASAGHGARAGGASVRELFFLTEDICMYRSRQQSRAHLFSHHLGLALALATCMLTPATAADKQRIEKEVDLPRFSYVIKEPLEAVVRDKATFARVTEPVGRDIRAILEKYDIADKAARRQFLVSLAQLDFLAGDYDGALAKAEEIRSLEEKPASKLLSGLRLRAMAKAASESGPVNSTAYLEAVGKNIRAELDTLPHDVISNDVKNYKAGAETMGEGRIIGDIRDRLQPPLTKTGTLSSDLAPDLINSRYVLETGLPLKKTLIATYAAYLDQHKVEKKDVWSARDITLAPGGTYHVVNVAVWDTGVDTALFKEQLALDAKGKPLLIAYDLDSRAATGELFPLPARFQSKLPEMLARSKGFSDLRADVDSPEASELKQYLSNLKAEEYRNAFEQLNLTSNYVHGTHVAGIALKGNPWARLVTGRISYDYKLLPDPCPSKALSERNARGYRDSVAFFRRHHVRVVNMSWGSTVKDYEQALEQCAIGKTAKERQDMARRYFTIEKKALQSAFAGAPEILFVAAAGNYASDASFDELIPSSLVLPNLLTAGAVDQAGDEAPFTSYGPTVVVHANGYQVESYLPGGSRVPLSGTSMSSPNVANLAAKLLAARPALRPAEVIALILATADKSTDGRRILINPAKAMASLPR
jgi:subtilisin family serine protease